MRVFLIDDMEDILFLLLQGLKEEFPEEKLNFFLFTSPKEAWEKIEKEKIVPDIIIVDYDMPDGDGVSFAKKVKEKYPLTYIILFTGHIVDFIIMGNEIDEAVSKPSLEGDIFKAFEKALKKNK